MIDFRVCPHDTKKGLDKWLNIAKKIKESLVKRWSLSLLKILTKNTLIFLRIILNQIFIMQALI
jgi:hypothetical protein